jgi:hypothetical protein
MDEFLKTKYEGNIERYSRKVNLKSVIREEHEEKFTSRVLELSDFIRNAFFLCSTVCELLHY